jgi:hypothetical protein
MSFSQQIFDCLIMDIAYLHLITNHIPIIGVPFAIVLLLLGIWLKSDELKTAAFLIFVFLGAVTLGVYLLGQGGEDFVEDLAGVSEQAIEDHEDCAKFALAAVAATAIVSLFALIRYRGFAFLKRQTAAKEDIKENEISASNFPNWLTFAILFLALASGGILGYAGKLGGQIRHTEFYGGAQETLKRNENNRRGKIVPKSRTVEPETPPADQPNDQDTEENTNTEEGKRRGRGDRKENLSAK